VRPDTLIKSDVECELQWDRNVDDRQVRIRVARGVLTMTGQIDSPACRFAAENVGRSIAGVRAVVSDMRPGTSVFASRTDEDIAVAILHELRWAVFTHGLGIIPIVHEGEVRLTGTVRWAFQRRVTESTLAGIAGIVGMTNEIHVLNLPTIGGYPDRLGVSRVDA
jgi:osmotically-inducible protein OsmY